VASSHILGGLQDLLAIYGVHVVAQSSDANAVELIKSEKPDLAIIERELSPFSDFTLLSQLSAGTKVILLCPRESVDFTDELAAGIKGCLSSRDPLTHLRDAITTVLRNGVYLPGKSSPSESFHPNLTKGSKLARFQILDMIGEGGMATVYKALDPNVPRIVAIKLVPTMSPDMQRRLKTEAKAFGLLNHPNVVILYEFVIDPLSFLVLEYVEGRSLRDHLASGALTVAESLAYVRQAAEALKAVHAAKIVHLDVKPGNFMVTPKGQVKLLDFGISKLLAPLSGDTVTLTVRKDIVAGTWGYMSPEQISGRPTDSRADVFSLGVVFYEMLAGKSLFLKATVPETIHAIMSEQPDPLNLGNPSVSGQLDSIVRRAVAKDPGQRYPSISDMIIDLDRLSLSS
jgi:serine/threonine protein kinase